MNADAPSVPTPEEIAQAIKLESIFAPQTRARRDQKFRSDNPEGTTPEAARIRFAHYTSAEAAIKILETKRLWMRNTTCMTDFREVEHGYGLLYAYFSQPAKRKQFLDAMNSVSAKAGDDAVAFFDQLWGHIRTATYITCMSEYDEKKESEIGRLSMWRGFASDVPRVALVLSVPWHANLGGNVGVIASPCAYVASHEGARILDGVVENVIQAQEFLKSLSPDTFRNWIFQALLIIATCTKHHGFEEEKEWRAVHTPALKIPTVVTAAKTVHQGVPQAIFELPLNSALSPRLAQLDISMLLDRVIIGPTVYGSVMRQTFIDALEAAHVPEPRTRVFNSDIPIRT